MSLRFPRDTARSRERSHTRSRFINTRVSRYGLELRPARPGRAGARTIGRIVRRRRPYTVSVSTVTLTGVVADVTFHVHTRYDEPGRPEIRS